MPRTKRNVTPVEPEDDLGDLLEAAVARVEPAPALDELVARLAPSANAIRGTVAGIALIPVTKATPAERTQLMELRDLLDKTRADLSTWVDAIDISFRNAAMTTGAREIVLADGVVTVEPPRGEWVVNVPALKDELKDFVRHGVISQEEFDSIFEVVVTEKANNSRLNYFAGKRGEELAEAINRYRVWREGNPANAKVRVQRRAK